jgi:hypothetical protein
MLCECLLRGSWRLCTTIGHNRYILVYSLNYKKNKKTSNQHWADCYSACRQSRTYSTVTPPLVSSYRRNSIIHNKIKRIQRVIHLNCLVHKGAGLLSKPRGEKMVTVHKIIQESNPAKTLTIPTHVISNYTTYRIPQSIKPT